MRRAFVSIVSLGLLLAACGPAREPTASVPEALRLVWEKNSISASLKVTMTFNDHGKTMTAPTECSITDIPLTWTGNVFAGSAYEDPDERVICAVWGTVSADGAWIDDMKFSRQVAGQSEAGIDFKFKVAVRNVPIATSGTPDPATVGVFDKVGDVRKHIKSIDYSRAEIDYVSTEWQNATPPALRIKLDRVTRPMQQAPAQGAGCPCEW